MARSKDDADKLRQNRKERRELIQGLSSDGDFDDISEVTQPDIHITVQTPPTPLAQPPAEKVPSKPPRSGWNVLYIITGSLDKLPTHHRLYAFLGLVVAALVAYLAYLGIWGK